MRLLRWFLPLFCTLFGAFLVHQAHEGLLDGIIELLPPRGGWGERGPQFTTSESPRFLLYASALYAGGLVTFVSGLVYFTTGHRFFPSLRTDGWFFGVLFVVGLMLWSIMYNVLPDLYD